MNNSKLYPYDIKKKTLYQFKKKTIEYGAITLIPVFLSFRDDKKRRKS